MAESPPTEAAPTTGRALQEVATMSDGCKKVIATALTAVLCVVLFYAVHAAQEQQGAGKDHVTVGFVLDGDAESPYSSNFIRAIRAIEAQYGDRANLQVRYNVPYDEAAEVLEGLVQTGCDLVFTNSSGYGDAAKAMAEEHPNVQFCCATCSNANEQPILANYHTFMGEIYEGRYVSGKVAGMKINEMIGKGLIDADEAWLGYVAAYPYPEVISGYTAFFLGARSECPTVRMRVKYANTWSGYAVEKEVANQLIGEGCAVISQHTNTVGPAIACEEANLSHPVYHVGYNQDMTDVAPATSIVSTRINWVPYCCSVVEAVLANRRIEDVVRGHVHGNDIGAGFKEGWVDMLSLNSLIAPQGCEAAIESAIESLSAGTCPVFVGDYIGIDPVNAADTWDLRMEYRENESSSAPTFHYVLQDVIVVE